MTTSYELQTVLNKAMEVLSDFRPFPFFGTLLGLAREGKPINGDDDVDLYLEDSCFHSVKQLLLAHPGVEIEHVDDNSPYLQIRFDSNRDVPVDLYFFRVIGVHLVEKWNFAGLPNMRPLWMKTPSELIFPLREISLGEDKFPVCLPNQPEALLSFLYGKKWHLPRRKGADYFTLVLFGRPWIFEGPLARIGIRVSRLLWTSGILGTSYKR